MKGSAGFKHIALKRFEVFLDQHSYRKTSERFAVLEELYSLDRHIDVEGLFVVMRNKQHSISRATIYNTLDLLVQCGLAVKHQFREQNALYEQALVYQHHDHLVCNDCDVIKEFTDSRIDDIKQMVSEDLKTEVKNYSLVLYGDCKIPNCENKGKSSPNF